MSERRRRANRVMAQAVLVLLYVGLSIGVLAGLLEAKPPPQWLIEDHGYYELAYERATAGEDPYEDHEIGTAYLYPPQALLYVAAIEQIDRHMVKTATFFGISLAALGLMLLALRRYSKPKLSSFLIGIPVALFFGPLLVSTYLGQVNLLVCFWVVVAVVSMRSLPFWSGVALSIAAALKLTPLAYAALIVRGRWKPFLIGLLFGSGALFVAAGSWFGWNHYIGFLRTLSRLGRNFPLGGNTFSAASGLYLIGHKVGIDIGPHLVPVQFVLNAFSLILFLVVVWLSSKRPGTHIGYVALALLVTLAPNIVWYHHLTLLLPAVLIILWEWADDLWANVIVWTYLLLIQALPWALPGNYRPVLLGAASSVVFGFVLFRLATQPTPTSASPAEGEP